MPVYNIIATVEQVRAYAVQAESAEAALEIVREDHEWLEFDVIDSEVVDLSSED